MLARMNFAAQLATNQKFNLRDAARGNGGTSDALVAYVLDRLTPPDYDSAAQSALTEYVLAGGAYTGSDAQLATKTAGLVHLVLGSGAYQLV
jgi:hypothetical protein